MRKFLVAALLATVSFGAAKAVEVDPRLPDYKPTSGVSGKLKSVGSDTLNNLMTLWAEDFKKLYPGVTIEIEGKGSSTAPPALTQGTAQFGPMSRPMRPAEEDAFVAKWGYKPVQVRVAVDALAVYVNKDNPIKCLSLAQVEQIFAVGGGATKWDDVGLSGDFAGKPISMFGRNSASGTYGYFKEVALMNKDYKATVKEQPGSSAVVQGVAADKFAIGYSGIGYRTADVRPVPLSGRDGVCHEATPEKAYQSKYPIARALFMYVNKNPGAPTPPVMAEFLKFVLSKQGQGDTIKDGYFPLPYVFVQQERGKLGLD
jgi:phosphate transport system substrate-binding protein